MQTNELSKFPDVKALILNDVWMMGRSSTALATIKTLAVSAGSCVKSTTIVAMALRVPKSVRETLLVLAMKLEYLHTRGWRGRVRYQSAVRDTPRDSWYRRC